MNEQETINQFFKLKADAEELGFEFKILGPRQATMVDPICGGFELTHEMTGNEYKFPLLEMIEFFLMGFMAKNDIDKNLKFSPLKSAYGLLGKKFKVTPTQSESVQKLILGEVKLNTEAPFMWRYEHGPLAISHYKERFDEIDLPEITLSDYLV